VCCSPRWTSGSSALGLRVPSRRAETICLLCLGFKSAVILKDLASPCCVVAAIMFRRVVACSSLSSDPAGDGGSAVVGLGARSSLKGLSNPSSSDERSRFSAKGLMLSSLFFPVLSVC